MNFLDQVTSHHRTRKTFRLAVAHNYDLLSDLGLDGAGQEELKALLQKTGYDRVPDTFLDTAFRKSKRLGTKTRFSDGSFPVFYSSLETSTAEAEIRYWMPRVMGKPTAMRTAYYQEVTCTFDGIEKDLRGMVGQWPDLIHKTDYKFCNRLGAEAVRSNVDAFVTPSVRRSSGSNLPIFNRRAASSAELGSVSAFTFNPQTGDVTVSQEPAQ